MNLSQLSFTIRPLLPTDQEFLWEMLYQAIYVPPGNPPPARSLLQLPEIAHYAAHWGRSGDLGKVAIQKENGKSIGAAWLRLFSAEDPGYGFVSSEIPELSLAVLPGHRRDGIGKALLLDLIASARGQYPALSLSVSLENPAKILYEKVGFQTIRKEGDSWVMRLNL